MMDMPVFTCPFLRSIEGLRGTVLLRRHPDHVARTITAIQRRNVPAWSAGEGGRPWSAPVAPRRRVHRRKGSPR